MSKRNLVMSLAVILLVALAVWGFTRARDNSRNNLQSQSNDSDTSEQANQPSNQSNTNPTAMTDCTRNFDQSKLQANINLKNQFVVLDVKDYGEIKIQLYDQDAPKTVENFLRLTNAGYYNCLTFHRVAKGFVIQGGDPTGDGTGGVSAFGREFTDELNPNSASYKAGYVKGTVAMANRGPNTNSSQFFITLGDLNTSLPKNYTIFGKVVAGMDIVEKIGQVEVEPGPFGPGDGMPLVPVVITKATITSK
jgi:cyclophilin family peptidyl-prolyl cis-trans isomerase